MLMAECNGIGGVESGPYGCGTQVDEEKEKSALELRKRRAE